MIIGVPKEIKTHEYRVGLVPSGVQELVKNGHDVLVEKGAGLGIGALDEDYIKAGGKIALSAQEVFEKSDMIVKVKEPQPQECGMLRENQVLFTYLHLAPDPVQLEGLIKSKSIAIAYETVTDSQGRLPLLAPMSEVAGRMSIQVGASSLEKYAGGAGILMGGVPGVEPAKVTIIGGGVVGLAAARMAVGLGANVTILDRSPQRLQELDLIFGNRLRTIFSTAEALDRYVVDADLVIGAVLLPGAAAPKLVTKDMISRMRNGSVVVDVAIDQGGCFETSRPTTHSEPTFMVDGVVHYCVANMPGAVARTSAFALNNATLPFVLSLAQKGYLKALQEDVHLRNGLNVYKGHVTYQAVCDSLGYAYKDPSSIF
jgi:alanine dehydrogenase